MIIMIIISLVMIENIIIVQVSEEGEMVVMTLEAARTTLKTLLLEFWNITPRILIHLFRQGQSCLALN